MSDSESTVRGGSTRQLVLGIAIFVGVLELAGVLIVGSGGLGTAALSLGYRYVPLFLLTGPISLLPASVLAIWRPRLAGAWLSLTGVASAFFAVLVMAPTPNTWSPGGDSLGYYTFKWSLTLIIPFSLPMFVFGLWLIVSRLTRRST